MATDTTDRFLKEFWLIQDGKDGIYTIGDLHTIGDLQTHIECVNV
jgi:hypothetical protein